MKILQPFNNPEVFVQSWYAAALSHELARGHAFSRDWLGRRIALYRGQDGRVRALAARCAHLGADLGLGRVVEGGLRCGFHHWRYDGDGRCSNIPSQKEIPAFAKVASYPVEERYGVIWLFNGPRPIFSFPSFEGRPDAALAALRLRPQTIRCHPHVLACNGLDIQHFSAVHEFAFATPPVVEELDAHRLRIRLTLDLSGLGFFARALRLLAGDTLSAVFTTWGGNMATIESQAGRIPVLVLFTHCPLADGSSASQTILFLPKPSGLAAFLRAEFFAGCAVKLIMARITAGDRKMLESLRFQPNLIAADAPLAVFIRQVNAMPVFGGTSVC